MIVGRWYVQLASTCHWYLPLCIYVLFILFYFLSVPDSYLKKSGIGRLDEIVDDITCPRLICLRKGLHT